MIRKADLNYIGGIISLLYQVHDVHADGRPDIFQKGGIKYNEKELAEVLKNENTPVYVFENEEGKILGHLFCEVQVTEENHSTKARKSLYIDDICIDKNARGMHIGTALYEYAVGLAKSMDCNSILLNVWELNSGAKKFYEKCGMKPLKTYMEQVL